MKNIFFVLFSILFTSSYATTAGSIDLKGKPTFDVTLGSGYLNQTIDSKVEYYPPAGKIGGRLKYGFFTVGVGMMGLSRFKLDDAGLSTQTTNQEDLSMVTLDVGIVINKWLYIDAGYGTANFKRLFDLPNDATPRHDIKTAQGWGWKVGATLVPLRFGSCGIGLTYYYYGATASSYSLDSRVGFTQSTSTVEQQIHSSGSMTALSFLWDM